MYQVATLVYEKLIWAVQSISDTFRTKGQRPSSSHDQVWAKLHFESIIPIKCTCYQLRTRIGIVLCIFENLRSKGQR